MCYEAGEELYYFHCADMLLADGKLHLDDTGVWNQTIIVEGEDLDRRLVTASGTSAYVRDVDGTSEVKGNSENSY